MKTNEERREEKLHEYYRTEEMETNEDWKPMNEGKTAEMGGDIKRSPFEESINAFNEDYTKAKWPEDEEMKTKEDKIEKLFSIGKKNDRELVSQNFTDATFWKSKEIEESNKEENEDIRSIFEKSLPTINANLQETTQTQKISQNIESQPLPRKEEIFFENAGLSRISQNKKEELKRNSETSFPVINAKFQETTQPVSSPNNSQLLPRKKEKFLPKEEEEIEEIEDHSNPTETKRSSVFSVFETPPRPKTPVNMPPVGAPHPLTHNLRTSNS